MKKTLLCQSLATAFGLGLLATQLAAHAQTTPDDAATQRITVTGSSLKRVDAETAVPVTVIKADALKAQGITTIEQAMQMLSTNQSSQATSGAVGSMTAGASYADMRGLGSNKTLVLLNGRRLANNAYDGSAVDLNTIPFAAIERIEVLRDGASALYGTDAVGGVINFITRKDMAGGSITLGADAPQHAGGKSFSGSVGYGWGDLASDGVNVMAFLDAEKQTRIKATQRAFGKTGYIPSQGVTKSSGNSSPANYSYTGVDGENYTTNPQTGACTSPNTFASSSGTCRYDYTSKVDLVPDSQRTTGYLKGTFNLPQASVLTLEYFASQSQVSTHIAGVPYSGMTVNAGTTYYPGNGVTPAPTGVAIDSSQPITAYWRDTVSGGRQDQTTNTQQRLLATVDGVLGDWDYSTGLAYNQNRFSYWLTGGYTDGDLIAAGLADGTINPFGAQSAAGTAYIKAAAANGKLMHGQAETWSWDGHVSRELGDWLGAGRASALALGAEARREKSAYATEAALATQVLASTGIDPSSGGAGTRDVTALYAEFNLPLLQSLDVTAAVRGDHYSDFGNAVNPKLSLRYQPLKQVLVRSSFSKGFRAPSLYELNSPNTYTNSANAWNDPVNCAGGDAAKGKSSAAVCDTQFIVRNGGNHTLRPEKSQSATFGLVVEPVQDLTVSADLYWIRLQHQIGTLADTTVFGDPTKYAALFHRNSSGDLSVTGSDCPGTDCGYVDLSNQNLGGIKTSGVDLSFDYRIKTEGFGQFRFGLNGTYVAKYLYQNEENGTWYSNVGVYGDSGPIFRWQHTVNLNWSYGDWALNLDNRFKTHYLDQNALDDDTYNHHRVGSYSVWDISLTWDVTKALAVTGGVRNLFDTDPPFSNQGATFQQGYDPRYTDATGRTFFARATYKF